MPSWPDPAQLRQCALAVAVLDDIDLMPATPGVVLPGDLPILVTWVECRRAIAGARADSEDARHRLARWLQIRRWLGDRSLEELEAQVRPLGACVESTNHPGIDWVQSRVLGDALDLGIGFVGLDPTDPRRVVPVRQQLLHAAGIDPTDWWPGALGYLERMGVNAAERYQREPAAPLRPMGDCDVVTLLGSRQLRAVLVADVHGGMRTVAVPMRTRGWLDLGRIDPAFAPVASALTPSAERGFDRPLLLTVDEVSLARAGGDPLTIALDDPAPQTINLRDVLYHRS